MVNNICKLFSLCTVVNVLAGSRAYHIAPVSIYMMVSQSFHRYLHFARALGSQPVSFESSDKCFLSVFR